MLEPVFKEFFSAIENKRRRLFFSALILSVVGLFFLTTSILPTYLAVASYTASDEAPPDPTQPEKVSVSGTKNKTYPGCNIRGRGGRYVEDKIEINAPEGYSIVNWKEVPKKGKDIVQKKGKDIVQSRSNLSNPTFGNGDKFTAKCVGNGKVKKVLGIVVDHYNAWRYSDIILTLKRNKK